MTMSKHKEFLPALESARGIASLLVMVAHFWWWTMESPVGGRVLRCATLGVDFFFVLSGYILARNYLSDFPAPAGRRSYLWNRVVRIYPLHLFFVVAFAAAFLFLGRDLGEINWLAELTLLTSINSPQLINGVAWSLSAEWISYLAFAALLSIPGDRRRQLTALALVAASGVAVLLLTHGDITALRNRWGFVRAFFGFFIGVLAWRHGARIAAIRWLLPLAVALQAGYVLVGYGHEQLKAGMVLTFAPLVIHLSQPAMQRGFLSWRPVFWVGTVSFSLYMGHVFWGEVLEAILRRTGMPGPHWLELAKSAAAFAGAAVTYYLVERPARDLGRRLNPFARR